MTGLIQIWIKKKKSPVDQLLEVAGIIGNAIMIVIKPIMDILEPIMPFLDLLKD